MKIQNLILSLAAACSVAGAKHGHAWPSTWSRLTAATSAVLTLSTYLKRSAVDRISALPRACSPRSCSTASLFSLYMLIWAFSWCLQHMSNDIFDTCTSLSASHLWDMNNCALTHKTLSLLSFWPQQQSTDTKTHAVFSICGLWNINNKVCHLVQQNTPCCRPRLLKSLLSSACFPYICPLCLH